MKIRANAPRAKDLRDNCRRLDLTAQTEKEERWLSSLYMHIVHDGPEPGPRPDPDDHTGVQP